MRLDIYLQNRIEEEYGVKLSRTYVEKILEAGGVVLNDEVIKKKGFEVNPNKQMLPVLNDVLIKNMISVYQTGKRQDEEAESWDSSELGIEIDERRVAQADDITKFIILETDDLIAVNKPPGVSSHPGKGDHGADSMVYQFIKYMRKAHQYIPRAGLLHRLDKDTQGVLLFAKNMQTYNEVKTQFETRSIQKYYLAECVNSEQLNNSLKRQLATTRKEGRGGDVSSYKTYDELIDAVMKSQAPLELNGFIGRRKGTPFMVYTPDAKQATLLVGSKNCESDIYVISETESKLQLLFVPHTGRTHQIRAQARYLGCPVINDRMYGTKDTQGGTLGLTAIAVTCQVKGKDIKISLKK